MKTKAMNDIFENGIVGWSFPVESEYIDDLKSTMEEYDISYGDIALYKLPCVDFAIINVRYRKKNQMMVQKIINDKLCELREKHKEEIKKESKK